MRDDWERKRIGDFCETSAGGTPLKSHKDYYENGTIPWLRSGEVGQGEILESENFITEKGLNNSSAKLFPENSVLVAMYGATAGEVGILRFEAATNQAVCAILPNDSILPEYLYAYLVHYKEKLVAEAIGNAQSNLSQTKIKNIELPVPPLDEQKRIVSVLDEAFESIEQAKTNIEWNIENAKKLYQSKLDNLFLEIRDKWDIQEMGGVFDVRDGTHDSPSYQEAGYPLITSKNLKRGKLNYNNVKYISEEDYQQINKRSKVHIGDVLFAMIGTIGNPVVITEEPDYAIKNVALFKVDDSNDGHYLRYYLDSKYVMDKMEREAKGATQRFVGLRYLRSFPIPMPRLKIQNKISDKASELESHYFKVSELYKKKSQLLEKLKKSILKKAFSGELTKKKELVA